MSIAEYVIIVLLCIFLFVSVKLWKYMEEVDKFLKEIEKDNDDRGSF